MVGRATARPLSNKFESEERTMGQSKSDAVGFEGEEAGAGLAAPGLDLLAAGFLFALSVLVMIASWRLPLPDELRTAPGLLPFLTAASLGVMSIVLASSALKRRRDGVVMDPSEIRDSAEDGRVVVLALTVAIYIAALQLLAFQVFFAIAGVALVLSAFEPVTTIALATIIHFFWRGPLWITVVISTGWTLTLSLVFQKVFAIPLPGGF